MRSQKTKLGFAAATMLLSALPIFAQPGPHGGRFGSPGGPGLGLGMLEDQLDLTDAQTNAIKAIREQSRTQSQAILTQLQTSRQQVAAAAKANASDVELDRLTQQQATLSAQLGAIEAKSFRQVWQQLTPEQKATIEKREERRTTRMQRRGPAKQ